MIEGQGSTGGRNHETSREVSPLDFYPKLQRRTDLNVRSFLFLFLFFVFFVISFLFFACEQEYRLKDGRGGKRNTDVRTFTKDESSRWRIRAAEEEVGWLIPIRIRIRIPFIVAIRIPIRFGFKLRLRLRPVQIPNIFLARMAILIPMLALTNLCSVSSRGRVGAAEEEVQLLIPNSGRIPIKVTTLTHIRIPIPIKVAVLIPNVYLPIPTFTHFFSVPSRCSRGLPNKR